MHALVILFAATVSASGLSDFLFPPQETPSEADSDFWHYRGETIIRTQLLGYESSKIVSTDGEQTFVARRVPASRTEYRGRLMVGSKYFQLQLEPYTNSNIDSLSVIHAGLEIYAMIPLMERLRVGAYHHSSHNFWDVDYGHGINLNAFVLDLMLARKTFEIGGKSGYMTLKAMGHWYLTREGSPYLLTRDARVESRDIGSTMWRAEVDSSIRHPWGTSECGVYMLSGEPFPPASVRGFCSGTIALNRRYFGVWSEHLQVGPFVMGGVNLTRHQDFGRFDGIAGVRLTFVAVDNTYKMNPVWP